MKKFIENNIYALLPVYIKGKGDCTKIYMEKENVIIDYKLNTVIRNMAEYYNLDLKASSKNYGKILGIKDRIPINFIQGELFIPIKTRKPRIRNDAAYGYLNLRGLKDGIINGKDNKPELILKNDKRLYILSTYDTLLRSLANGARIKDISKEYPYRHSKKETGSLEVKLNYDHKDILE